MFYRRDGFMGASNCYHESELILFGAPMDFTTSFRPGARFGPSRIREVSLGLEEYSPVLDRELAEVKFYDAGDVEFPFGNVPAALMAIKEACRKIVGDKKIPFLLGGEHLVSLPAISAVYEQYPDLLVVHLDAHADLRSSYLGETNSHATVMRRVAEVVGPQNIYQFGIRSGTKEEFAYGKNTTRFFPFSVLEPLKKVLPELWDRSLYLSIDIDVVDPAYAPGTGTPEACGISSLEILQVIHLLRENRVVGLDIVELAPLVDTSDITALLVAKMVREAILAFGGRT